MVQPVIESFDYYLPHALFCLSCGHTDQGIFFLYFWHHLLCLISVKNWIKKYPLFLKFCNLQICQIQGVIF